MAQTSFGERHPYRSRPVPTINESADIAFAGLALDTAEKYGETITIFNKALKINPNDPDIHFNIGESYKNWKKYEEAIASYDYYEK